MDNLNQQTNRSSVFLIILIGSYFVFNIILLILPFLLLPGNENKSFWTMIITNIHLLFLLLVTMTENIALITSWLMVDVCHIFYFGYLSVVLVAYYINGMGKNTSGYCSLFTIAPDGNNCNDVRAQFKSAATVFIIVFVIIPVEVWLFISVTGLRQRKRRSNRTKRVTIGTQTMFQNEENKSFKSFSVYRSGANSKQKLYMSVQGEPQDDLINDLVNLSDMDLSCSLPQDGQLFPKSNNLFLQEKPEADVFKKSRLTIESSSAKKSLPSSVLTNYCAKIIPALKI